MKAQNLLNKQPVIVTGGFENAEDANMALNDGVPLVGFSRKFLRNDKFLVGEDTKKCVRCNQCIIGLVRGKCAMCRKLKNYLGGVLQGDCAAMQSWIFGC
ncbi:FAD/FMN_dependent oxidoreductase [Hexamita inflata]|uniref:FAD/FMN dependent oxidoreductase n=1 Tax=Hexamita inflata TaxID=28002 RepID=A0AA86RD44_9EUKA|nr:FAD/FMN dependent oxidoreductase [Hexamita inflata]